MVGRTFGFAIVGLGVIAPSHARAIADLPNARLRAVVDTNPELVRQRASEWAVDGYTELDAVLSRPDVEVVCVCVPSGLHAELGIRAALAGKHVVVEKPIDVTLAAADRLIAAARESGVALSVISQRRWDPGIRRLRAALEAGRFGRPILGDAIVKWYRSDAYYQSAGWRATWELDGGGALMNQAVHSVDLLLWLLGPVAQVVARTRTAAHDIAVEDLALALLTFESGALGVIEASTAVYPGLPERLEITGSGGTAIVEGGEVRVWQLSDERGPVGPYGASAEPAPAPGPVGAAANPGAVPASGHRAQLAEVLAAIAEGREPPVTGAEARRALALILAIYESARSGRAVDLPPGG